MEKRAKNLELYQGLPVYWRLCWRSRMTRSSRYISYKLSSLKSTWIIFQGARIYSYHNTQKTTRYVPQNSNKPANDHFHPFPRTLDVTWWIFSLTTGGPSSRCIMGGDTKRLDFIGICIGGQFYRETRIWLYYWSLNFHTFFLCVSLPLRWFQHDPSRKSSRCRVLFPMMHLGLGPSVTSLELTNHHLIMTSHEIILNGVLAICACTAAKIIIFKSVWNRV